MKTLVDGTYTKSETTHAIISSSCYVQYLDVNTPIWHDEKLNLAKTENVLGNIDIYQTDENGNAKTMRLSHTFIKSIYDKMQEIINQETEPDYPKY